MLRSAKGGAAMALGLVRGGVGGADRARDVGRALAGAVAGEGDGNLNAGNVEGVGLVSARPSRP